MKTVLLFVAGGIAAAAAIVWRTQHSPEVWHTVPQAGPNSEGTPSR
jgi:hypothetical protein